MNGKLIKTAYERPKYNSKSIQDLYSFSEEELFLDKGEVVLVLETNENWSKVLHNEKIFYLFCLKGEECTNQEI